MEYNIPYSLAELIAYAKNETDRDDNFCLYAENYGKLTTDGHYYVADYPEVDDGDNEQFPPIVQDKKLELVYYGQQFVDVIDSVLNQKTTATIEEYVKALNYYSEKDNFLDL